MTVFDDEFKDTPDAAFNPSVFLPGRPRLLRFFTVVTTALGRLKGCSEDTASPTEALSADGNVARWFFLLFISVVGFCSLVGRK